MAKIVHFEIPVDDPQRAVAFYHDVLGWQVSRFGEEPYWLVRAGEDEEPGANGALVGREELHRSPVLIAGVADIDDVLSRAHKCGGEVVQGKLPVPGMGWSAYIRDPGGQHRRILPAGHQRRCRPVTAARPLRRLGSS